MESDQETHHLAVEPQQTQGHRQRENEPEQLHRTTEGDDLHYAIRHGSAQSQMATITMARSPTPRATSTADGSEDQSEAYRSIPNAEHQLNMAVIGVVDPDDRNNAKPNPKIVFTTVRGHLYGLKAAVNNFNRTPEIIVAIARRILA